MNVDDLYKAVRDRWPKVGGSPVALSKLERLLSAALAEYNRWNPILESAVLDPPYEVPEGLYRIVAIDVGAGWRGPSGDVLYNLWSQGTIEDIKREQWRGRVETRYAISGGAIVFDPPVHSKVTIVYTALRGVEDVPEEDAELLMGIMLADMLESAALEASLEPDYAEGLERVTVSRIPGNALEIAERYRAKLQAKYGGGICIS